MDNLLNMGSQALKKAALNEEAKEFILKNEILFKTLKKAANRYIGGETLDETILKVISQNKRGFKCSIEFMGESTKTEDEANDGLANHHLCSIATHHNEIQQEVKKLIRPERYR